MDSLAQGPAVTSYHHGTAYAPAAASRWLTNGVVNLQGAHVGISMSAAIMAHHWEKSHIRGKFMIINSKTTVH